MTPRDNNITLYTYLSLASPVHESDRTATIICVQYAACMTRKLTRPPKIRFMNNCDAHRLRAAGQKDLPVNEKCYNHYVADVGNITYREHIMIIILLCKIVKAQYPCWV